MIIISAGFRKSASTFVYDFELELVELLSNRSGQAQLENFSTGRGRAYRGKLDFKTFLVLLYINFFHGDAVLKTHGKPTFWVTLLAKLGLAKITYTYRDPRDVAVSIADHGKKTRNKVKSGEAQSGEKGGFREIHDVKEALPLIEEDIEAYYGWQKQDHILIIKYEDLMTSKENELIKLANHLEYQVKSIEVENTIKRYLDYKNNNFNAGTSKRYLEKMTSQDIEFYNGTLGKTLDSMNYAL